MTTEPEGQEISAELLEALEEAALELLEGMPLPYWRKRAEAAIRKARGEDAA